MPYRSETGGFTPGDSNVAEFIDDVVEPFLTDAKGSGGLGWISQTPAGSPFRGKGSSPNFEFIFSRGTPGSEAPPYWFMQTTAKTCYIYSGNGVNLAQESFDQPGNPCNSPNADPPGDLTNNIYNTRSLALTTVVGPYDGYWVFGGPTGEYCHVVLKVGARQYRHFHIGMLDRFDDSLSADTFYVTNHRWGFLGPDNLATRNAETNTTSKEHQPYYRHILPFANNDNDNQANSIYGQSKGMIVYSPNYGTEGYDWWYMAGVPVTIGPTGGGSGFAVQGQWKDNSQPGNVRSVFNITKPIGDVNTNNNSPEDIKIGLGFVSGYGESLGAIPFSCKPTFTTDGIALIPIIVGLGSDFESTIRWSPVGQVPDVFRVNMRSLDPEQEITIGSDTYVVFPLINKDANNTVANEGYSGYEGLAYKKITANAT